MQTKKWWKEAVVYQIYPRSFQDSNGDGVGDLAGITSRLDYLQELGVNVLWVCPMYKSPQDDNGYDISDYQAIHHEYGTMEDFDHLLKEAHRRGMKLLVDLVINHTSDEHPWFVESSSSKTNPKRDWYIWRDGKNGKEPNNWESIFGGSAWKLDAKTGQYFLHVFSAKQPDLNWENPEMREAVYAMMRWWMDKGIDGFRIDAISHMKKEPTFASLPNPQNIPFVPSYASHMNVDGIQKYLEDICENTFRRYDIMTVGEANGVSAEDAHEWAAEKNNKLNMLIQFEHVGLWSADEEKRIDLPKVKAVLNRWQKAMEHKGWNALYVENHDIPRITSKWGDPINFWRESATSIAAMYFLMQGTPFIYQGQEIGMTNTEFSGPQDFNDVLAQNTFRIKKAEGKTEAEITAELAPLSRDNARTPMHWSSSAQAGFTTGKPWLKVNPNFLTVNVEAQRKDPQSIFHFYRELIALRKSDPTWVYGSFELVEPEHEKIFAYTRTLNQEQRLVVANVSPNPSSFPIPPGAELLLGNYESTAPEFRPFESRVYRCKL
jgi:alpha-glucosidase